MANGYVPGNDSAFTEWAQRFLTYVAAHEAEFGVTPAEVAALADLQSDWTLSYDAHAAAQVNAKTCTTDKLAKRKSFEEGIRPIVARIQSNPNTTNVQREAMGLTPKGGASPSSAEITDERPMLLIDITPQMKHILRTQTQTSTGTKRGRPASIMACELWRKVGEAPSSVQDMEYIGLLKRNPHTLEYAIEDAGKMAYYAVRWVNSRGEPCAWSETESATIAA